LTLPFTLAYDGNRQNQQVWVFRSDYAIFDLASGTVLDRGNVATRCGLDAARIPGFGDKPPKYACEPAARDQFATLGARSGLWRTHRGRTSVSPAPGGRTTLLLLCGVP
jgi:hypothetical protein